MSIENLNLDIFEIDDLFEANDAGTEKSSSCTLILTEGIATKSLVVAGLTDEQRDIYGVYALKYNIINFRKGNVCDSDNPNVKQLVKLERILGLNKSCRYETDNDMKTLRYGKVLFMIDRDEDGSHTKGLLINYFHYHWPLLLRWPFLSQFITPVVNVLHDNHKLRFYTFEEYEEYKNKRSDKNISAVFYKSLESFSSSEIRDYFSFLDRHVVNFSYSGEDDDDAINLAFGPSRDVDRKQWITDLNNESIDYYEGVKEVKYKDFIHKELSFYSDLHNERSIASVVDGLTRSQRKVLYTLSEKKILHEVNFLQLIGYVYEISGYKHSETSLSQTIIKMGQNFVGTNNINILLPIGQFGSRIYGGKDSGKPKFLRTKLNDLTNFIFSDLDKPILKRRHLMEPTFYIPIIPLILVNGTEGIGTGWKTLIPNYNPLDIIRNIYRLMDRLEPVEMTPWYKNFKGTIEKIDGNKFRASGVLSYINDDTICISELPVGESTENYRMKVLNPMLVSRDISSYRERHTDTIVNFVVSLGPKFKGKPTDELRKEFKLHKVITISAVAFDQTDKVKDYKNPIEILKEFYNIRLKFYESRRDFMIWDLSMKLEKQVKFLGSYIGKIENGFSIIDPHTGEITYLKRENTGSENKFDDIKKPIATKFDENFDILSNIYNYAKEQIKSMEMERSSLKETIDNLKNSSYIELWKNDLKKLEYELERSFEDSRQATSSASTSDFAFGVENMHIDQ